MTFHRISRSPSPSAPPARWVVREHSVPEANRLTKELRIHPALARVLAGRGWRAGQECSDFLSPRLMGLRDPFELRDMDRAVERTVKAIRSGEQIGVFGDYDVDGVSSTAIMVLTLRFLGASPQWFIPHRIDDGYGMQSDRIADLARNGVTLLITVDTGITAVEEVRHAQSLGMDVVVTDHHLADSELPDAAAIVNPNRPDAIYDGARLCGAGVAFKFVHALLKGADVPAPEAKEFLKGLLDLVALGTIADVVPLKGENRLLAHFGLECLSNSPRPGIRALLKICKLEGRRLTAEHVGFALGPRINAAGRTDHAGTALELLLTEDDARAAELATKLNSLNTSRRSEEAGILKLCLKQAESQMESGEDSLLVVDDPSFHLGIVGIVASRLADRFYRPAIVLRSDPELARGSARSIPRFDVHEALGACESYLEGYGGHAAAAGVRIAPARIDEFRTAINGYASNVFQTRDMTPEIAIDTELDPEDISWELFDHLAKMEPFGEDNPAPVFLLRNVSNAGEPRIVGSNHLKLYVQAGTQRRSAIGFNKGHLMEVCNCNGSSYDLLCQLSENNFRGDSRLELTVLDARASD